MVFFLATGAVSALVGCAVFLLHPLWRRWYRARKPRAGGAALALLVLLPLLGLFGGCAAPLALQPETVVGGEALQLQLSPEECAGLRKEVRRASAVEMGAKALVAGLGAGSALHGALGASRGAQVGLAVGTLLAGGMVAVADYLSDSAAQEHSAHCPGQ